MKKKIKILVITPVKHIKGVVENLSKIGDIIYLEDCRLNDLKKIIHDYDAIFTNPNKSKIFLSKNLIDLATNLKVICTASTGTNHIDIEYAKKKKITILSLKEERKIINEITSTAEHALALTLASLRNIKYSFDSVLKDEWDYTKFIGRQMNQLKVGIIGYGRLGKLYSGYCNAMGAEVLSYDPYKKIREDFVNQFNNLEKMVMDVDILSLHVHVNENTVDLINKNLLNRMKSDVIIINTSRGEIINESDLVEKLTECPLMKVATDVLTDEVRSKEKSKLLEYAKNSSQVLITPHIGGMTSEAQEIAYNHSALRLTMFFEEKYQNETKQI